MAAVAVSTAGALPVFLVGALAVQMRADLEFSKAALGLAPTAYFATGALTSAAGGRLVERVGPRRGMRLAALTAAAAMLAVAGLARSWPQVLGLLVLAGVANAVAQPGSNLLLARSVRSARRGTAFGVKQSSVMLAMLLGGFAVPTVALTVGWRWAFAGAAGLALASAALVPDTGEIPAEQPPGRVARPGLRPLVLLAAAAGLGAAAANMLGTFLVESSVEQGVAEGTAGLLYALGAATGLTARLATGVAADRRPGRHELFAVAFMLGGGAAGYGLLATGSLVLLVPAVLLAYGLGWGWPGLFNYSVVGRYPVAPGAATGITQTGVYVGAVVGPLAFGLVAEEASFAAAWLLGLGGSAAAAAVVTAAARWLDRSAVADAPETVLPAG